MKISTAVHKTANEIPIPYKPPILFRNGHTQSIYPSLFRHFDIRFYQRERIYTPDEDFLDLDWSPIGSNRLAIISHGLEGSSDRGYAVGMVKALNNNGWETLAWNFRSCSGEINWQLRSYHSGAIDDLELVINHALQNSSYQTVALIGFSMGGNLTLVYLGKRQNEIPSAIKKAVVFSTPCDLKGSAKQLEKWSNTIYMKRFLNLLHQKIKAKMKIMPDKINDHNYDRIKNFRQFDDRYTAPIHGFVNAEDYWQKCSSKQFIPQINIPTLIVNAKNDPFLSESCYPIEEASMNANVTLEIPDHGGHVGFVLFNKEKMFWSEKRAIHFLN